MIFVLLLDRNRVEITGSGAKAATDATIQIDSGEILYSEEKARFETSIARIGKMPISNLTILYHALK
jgi:hypothetical protein